PLVLHSFPTRRSSDLTLALRETFGPPVGDLRERQTSEQIVDPRRKRTFIDPVQTAVVENVFARGQLRIQPGRMRQHTEQASRPQDRKSTRLNSSHVKI